MLISCLPTGSLIINNMGRAMAMPVVWPWQGMALVPFNDVATTPRCEERREGGDLLRASISGKRVWH